jgi:outer membrane receptor protein involved in Fe transport
MAAIGLAAGLWAGAAWAQDDTKKLPSADEGEKAATQPIIITGSRIVRRDYTADSPITTIDKDTFEDRSSFNVESALNQLPQFTPSGTSALGSSAGTPFAGPQNAPGAALLNLRGLGPNRNLVLVNGRRPQPVNAQLVVDINTIPAAAIASVETITGGAGAVYGADAIAGVVNFKMRDNFEGFELDGQYGITEKGDNSESQVSALVGGNFGDDRGNAMVGAVWSQRGVALQKDREFYTRGWNDPLTNGAGVGNAVPGLTQANVGPGLDVNFDGTLFNPLAPNSTGPGYGKYTGPLQQLDKGAGFHIGPNGQLQYNDPASQINIPSTRYSFFGNAHYKINNYVTAFVEGTYTHNFTSAQSLVPPAFNVWAISVPYNHLNDDPNSPTFGTTPNFGQTNFHPVPSALAAMLNARANPDAPWTMTRSLDFLGRLETDTTADIYQITAGFRGNLPVRDWSYEVYGSHGNTNEDVAQPSGSISQANLTEMIWGLATGSTTSLGTALPPPTVNRYTATGPWGQNWTTGEVLAVNASCKSGIPIFNPNGSVPQQVQVSQDCVNFATLETNNITQLEQNIVEADVQGSLFKIPWSDDLRFNLGVSYRSEDFNFNPDSGLSGEQDRANVINLIALPLPTHGLIDVSEAYGELLVPILSDMPAAKKLEMDLGYRYGDYNTAGGNSTYMAMGDWTVTDWLTFRGGYQRANRAPNIYELFAPVTAAIDFNGPDACANILSTTPPWGNLATNPNRANVQAACEELIKRDGGFDYKTINGPDKNPGQDPSLFGTPALDLTHLSNFRQTVAGYNGFFPFTLALQQGNRSLQNEVADTLTAGVVLKSPVRSPLLDNLTMSVDWYSIDIKGTIAVPSAFTVYQQCLDPTYNKLMADPAGSHTGAELLAGSPYCALINREPVSPTGVLGAVQSGLARNFNATYVNLGGTKTSGIDVQVNWAADFADMGLRFIPGRVNASFVANFLNQYAESPFPGGAFIDYTGTNYASSANPFSVGFYNYRTTTTLGYAVGPGSVGMRLTYLPKINPVPGAPAGTQGANSHTQVDLFGRWALANNVDLRAGIDNVLDEQPEVVGRLATGVPATSNNALNSTNQNYDTLGRRFYVGATIHY